MKDHRQPTTKITVWKVIYTTLLVCSVIFAFLTWLAIFFFFLAFIPAQPILRFVFIGYLVSSFVLLYELETKEVNH